MDPCDQEHHDRPWHHHHWPSDRQRNCSHQWQDHCSRGCSVHQEQPHDGSSPCHLRVIRRRCGLGSCAPHHYYHLRASNCVVSRLLSPPPSSSSFPRRREPIFASSTVHERQFRKRLAQIVHHRWWKKYLWCVPVLRSSSCSSAQQRSRLCAARSGHCCDAR